MTTENSSEESSLFSGLFFVGRFVGRMPATDMERSGMEVGTAEQYSGSATTGEFMWLADCFSSECPAVSGSHPEPDNVPETDIQTG